VTSLLTERMRESFDREAIVCSPARVTYRGLVDRMGTWLSFFDKVDIPSGAVVAIESGYSIEACSLLLALGTSGRSPRRFPAASITQTTCAPARPRRLSGSCLAVRGRGHG